MAKKKLSKNNKNSNKKKVLFIFLLVLVLFIGFNLKDIKYSLDHARETRLKEEAEKKKEIEEKEKNKQEEKLKNSNEYKLKEIGYNDEEIEYICNFLADKAEILLDYKYMDNIRELLDNAYFDIKNLKDNLDELNKGYTVDNILIHNKELKKCKYYLEKNLSKYYEDKNNNNKLDYCEIVLRVNTHINEPFYTNIKKTDTSKEYLMIVNKYYSLDSNYTREFKRPDSVGDYGYGKLDTLVTDKFIEMCEGAKKDGIILKSISAYRSYDTQKNTYNGYVNRDGKTKADTYSARPGHSEHQTGMAIDINTSSSSDHFEKTKEYNWLINNSYKYGFILRYPEGKEYITGYKFEPWHFRYIGIDAATYIYKNNITFEEYYAYFIEK